MKKKEIKFKRTASGRYIRFCEICGSHAGARTAQEWHQEGRMCKRCAEIYASSLEIEIDRANGAWKSVAGSWELDGERKRISRFL
ncbi:MAG: hypothetical protein P8175_02040 [Deltaproteobacteria bacterium]|jgi:hypothetical protein